jgi:two-component system chemotaxis sensor kinase CheA
MDSHLREFLAETEDSLEALFDDLRALRANRAEGRARRELVARIFRRVHTIKGSSATLELNAVAEVAHEFETLLDGVRLRRVSVDEDVLDAFEDTAQVISQSLAAVGRGGEEEPVEQALIERLRRLSRLESDETAREGARSLLAALPEELARSLGERELNRACEAIDEGAHLFVVSVKFDITTFDDSFRALSRALTEDGEIISTLPGVEGATVEEISFRILYAAPVGREDLLSRVSAVDELSVTEIRTGKAFAPEEDEAEGGRSLSRESSTADAPGESIVPVSKHVRVELDKLDEIIAATHEVLIEATDALSAAGSPDLQTSERSSIKGRAESVHRRLLELEENLIGLRMVSVARMLERAARAGRSVARQTAKEIDFELKGTDVHLDKTLADAVADPLLHILRNAVDHGIETSTERAAAGKSERGLIRLEALTEGNRVRLRIADDGRGIDPLRVARAAAAQGIIETGRTLTKEHALRLIFRPGFSTRSMVSNVSGRGVGLDVVESAVEQLGGQLRVASEPGRGTTFEIILPTTLALIQAYVVRSSGHWYCVDASHVNETILIAPNEIERSGTAEQVRLKDGSVLPLMRMRQLLAQPPGEAALNAEAGLAAILVSRDAGTDKFEGKNGRQTAIIVDSFEGQLEALVRGLGRYSARWRGVGGATILRDGSIALVLDLPRLLEAAS